MRLIHALTTSLLIACVALPATAQQLRDPADPPPHAGQTLRQVEPAPRIPTATGTRSAADPSGNAARDRCLQRATASIQPTSHARVASAQRQAAAVETQRAARGGDAADPTDRSGLRAQRDASQRMVTRERTAANQRVALAQANCR
ncbi:conserved exported hypothetical protein [Luteimonas sp. 9C]|uniref:hypothetical protein n=1 Tax=Luteimonas sp. 9C TaxID=2653148 RepID=UPI0012F33903|nr:hypothetical protein [Luteimonas sp. 9C]VXC06397.1 conserved exported hypothetical protein [Luteimonas sp. 9C]